MSIRGSWGSAWGGGRPSGNAQLPTSAGRDFEVVSPPSDGVTSLHFSPIKQPCLLLSSSWDQQLRIWEIPSTGQTVPKAATQLQQPVLCSAWSPDGTAAFAGGCDNTVQLWDLQSQQLRQVAAHQEPVRHLDYSKDLNLLVTASWDKTLKFWDLRQPDSVKVVNLPERVYALSLNHPMLVLGLANRQIQVYNMQNPLQPAKEVYSMLKFQTRCVTCFPDRNGYAISSVEGRAACVWLGDKPQASFTFKCHRNDEGVHAVNSIAFHPTCGTFATAGSDGTISFWDKDAKQRLKALPTYGQTISCANFNADGTLYACAASYDWSGGYAGAPSGQSHKIVVHPVSQSDVQPKTQSQQKR